METVNKTSSDTLAMDERFQNVVDELEKVKLEVESTRNWFKRNSTRPRILFQITGGVTILLSVLVPLLSTLDGTWQTFVLPAVAVAIAGLTGINAFFQWQSQWQGNRQTQYALEYLLSKWEVEIVKARFQTDREQGIEIAIDATHNLLDQAREVSRTTTSNYFKNIQLPTAK
jgi:hypothetical protein